MHIPSCSDYADIFISKILNHRSIHDSIDITVVPIYWLDVNQIIEYQMPNESEPSYWLIKSISTDFSVDGSQKISAIRYYTV